MQSWLESFRRYRAGPAQILAFGFLTVILMGALLLSTPLASSGGESIGWVDALFTSTSAVCVTGLIVKDTPSDFSLFGQIVILSLIQIGGLGYAASATVLVVLLGMRISMRERLVMKEALNVLSTEGVVRLTKWILVMTLVVELAGTIILLLWFLPHHDWTRAFYLGLFHSISAFNNAGFTLFSDSLGGFRSDVVMNIVVAILIVMGGIGFVVYHELYRYKVRRELHHISVHSKLVLLVTAVTIVLGTLSIYLFESAGQAMAGLSTGEKWMASLFHAVSARTAGFTTMDLSSAFTFTLFFMILLMFVGGSPSSTGGGVKTTTLGITLAALWATIKGKRDVTLFRRRIPPGTIHRAFLLIFIAVIMVSVFTLVLLIVEGRGFMPTLFEVVSGLATVGLSTGDGGSLSLSALFSDFGKLVMVLAIFIGRLGPLTIGIGAFQSLQRERLRFPEEKVIIG